MRVAQGLVGSAILGIAALIVSVLLAGCAANIASRGGRAGGIGTAHGSPERETVAAQPPPAPSIVEAVRQLVGDWRGVVALVSDVPPSVPPTSREIAAIQSVEPPPVSRGMSDDWGLDELENADAWAINPAATLAPAERGIMAWVNPHGEKYHLDPACPYVCRSSDPRPFCKGKPSAPMVLGLARISRKPCITCAGGKP